MAENTGNFHKKSGIIDAEGLKVALKAKRGQSYIYVFQMLIQSVLSFISQYIFKMLSGILF